MKDKYGKPLEAGDAVITQLGCTGVIRRIASYAEICQELGVPPIGSGRCGQCKSDIYATLEDGPNPYVASGCILTKLDGSGIEEEREEVECV